jgi:hypothetical protein
MYVVMVQAVGPPLDPWLGPAIGLLRVDVHDLGNSPNAVQTEWMMLRADFGFETSLDFTILVFGLKKQKKRIERFHKNRAPKLENK